MGTKFLWVMRVGKVTALGVGALTIVTLFSACPPAEEPTQPAPQEEPVTPPQ